MNDTSTGLKEASVGELALRLCSVRGTAVYAAYVAEIDLVERVSNEVAEELVALDPTIGVEILLPHSGSEFVARLQNVASEFVVVDVSSFREPDWLLLDRRRSSLARAGVMVLVGAPANLEELVQMAPNLSSWIGAMAFAQPREPDIMAETRQRRLASLRSWSGRSDDEVLQAATRGELPGDPEFAEWLVLLGRSDLFNLQEP